MSQIDLYNGDCLEVMQQLIYKDIKVDAVITDIPYFQIVSNQWDNQWKTEIDYLNWVEMVIQYFMKLIQNNGSLLMFTGRQMNRKICAILDKYMEEKRIIIWSRKRAFNNTRGKALASGYEPICYYSIGNSTFNNLKIKQENKRPEYNSGILKDGVSLSDCWNDISALPHNSKEKVNHPTQKPLVLMERCIKMITNENDLVLDPFMGSGSTGVACKNLNRNFIGIELDKSYFDITKDRINESD